MDVEGSPGGPVANVSRVRFLGRGVFKTTGVIAEIQVFGDGAVPQPAAPAEVNLAELFAVTLNASSFQDDGFHRLEAVNDDHPGTMWYAASTALQFFEIVFPIDVTATRIEAVNPGARTDFFGSSTTLSCFGKFQLFDASGAVLFDTGEVNAPLGSLNGPGPPFAATVPNVDGVRRLRYTQTQGCDPGFGGGPGSYPVGFSALRLFGSPSVPAPRLDMFKRFQSLAGNNIHSTPLVANLTDDNGDGRIDRNDTPDIVAMIEGPGSQVTGTMKVLSGDDGRELFTAGVANSVSPWSEPAVGDLDGDGIPEIVAVHSDGNHLIAFTPASGEVQGNLTQLVQPLTFNASSTNPSFPPALAADGNLNTEWLTVNIAAGTSPFYELAFPQNVEVSELRMFGSRHLTVGHDIFAGKFELFAADGTLLFDSGEVSLPSPDQDATVPVPNVAGVRRVRFTATAHEIPEPGFAELEVIGSAILPANVGRVLWVSDAHTQSTFFNGATVVTGAVAIANLDGAGAPEIIVGAAVYDADGKLLGDGASLGGTSGGSPVKRSAISVVSDIDLDGVPEIVAGPTAYQLRSGGLVKVWQRSDRPDGFAALGNFDADAEAEIVIVADGQVYMLNHDGSDAEVWNPPTHAPIALPGGGSGGAPTIGDFDGDGVPEIGIAGSFGYTVLERDGSTLWKTAIMDYSSNSTGSTTFDFEQDGSVEVIYRDERFMRVYRGADGLLLAKQEIHSLTWTEEPVVADVDGDGDAELIICGDSSGGSTGDGLQGTPGIHVFEDPAGGWAPTRKIWNQHGYHITNVNEDGTIPLVETTNWLAPGAQQLPPEHVRPGRRSRLRRQLHLLRERRRARFGRSHGAHSGPGKPAADVHLDPARLSACGSALHLRSPGHRRRSRRRARVLAAARPDRDDHRLRKRPRRLDAHCRPARRPERHRAGRGRRRKRRTAEIRDHRIAARSGRSRRRRRRPLREPGRLRRHQSEHPPGHSRRPRRRHRPGLRRRGCDRSADHRRRRRRIQREPGRLRRRRCGAQPGRDGCSRQRHRREL